MNMHVFQVDEASLSSSKNQGKSINLIMVWLHNQTISSSEPSSQGTDASFGKI